MNIFGEECSKKAVITAAISVLIAFYIAIHCIQVLSSVPNTMTINISHEVENLAAQQGIPVEEENAMTVKFEDSVRLGGAGGLGATLIDKQSGAALVATAKRNNLTIHYVIEHGYNRVTKTYMAPANEACYEWKEVYVPADNYQINPQASSNTQIVCDRTSDGFGIVVSAILGGLLFFGVMYYIWAFLDGIRRFIRDIIRSYRNKKKIQP